MVLMRIKIIFLVSVLAISLTPSVAHSVAVEKKAKNYTVTMKKAHLPAAPNNGTDDYRCFLLDPKVGVDSIIRTIEFVPQRKNYVHHAIIFRVTDADLAEAKLKDKSGNGWECFGGSGLGGMLTSFTSSPWLSSWAPGRGIDISPAGYGTPFEKGEQLVLQVHYNLLAANGGAIETDQSKIKITAIPAKGSKIKQLNLELFPAPVELACPKGVTGPLCDRRASLVDLAARTSASSALEASGLNFICGLDPRKPVASLTSKCERRIGENFKIIAAAAHMHLLGQSLTMILNEGSPNEKVIFDVQNYNFDDQSATILKNPIDVVWGDRISVKCTFDPTRRQRIEQLAKLEPRYVTWGEGSSDEMCLGVISAVKS